MTRRRTTAVATDPTPIWVPIIGIGLVVAAIFAIMNPSLLFSSSTPAGGDMGAHVAIPAYLRDVMLPEGRILGWNNDWFAGYPFLYFYFPLTSLATVLLNLVLSYGAAFKLVSILGLLTLAPAAYFLVRSMGFGRFVSTVAGAAGGAFVFMESFSIYGGNIPSTLAGEFSFSWSFTLMMIYLGLLIRAVKDNKHRVWIAGLVLGLTALTHLITTFMAILVSIPIMLWKGGARKVAATWAIGFGVAGFWAVPLLTRIGYSSDMAWTPLTGWSNIFPTEILVLVVPAVIGIVIATRKASKAWPFTLLTLFPVAYYWAIQYLPDWLPAQFHHIQDKLWNGRFLPFFYFGVWVFAGIALGVVLQWLAKELPKRRELIWVRGLLVTCGIIIALAFGQSAEGGVGLWAIIVVIAVGLTLTFVAPRQARTRIVFPLIGAVFILSVALSGVTYIPGWVQWNFSGYENKADAGEYFALMDALYALPPGRVQWEYSNEQNKYGTPMSLMLTPYWTGGRNPSMEGLFFESSLTTSFHFLNQAETSVAPSSPIPGLNYHPFNLEDGIKHLALYNIRYYVTYTEQARLQAEETPGLTFVAETAPFAIFELPTSSLVDVAQYVPAVYEGKDFGQAALSWYDGPLDRWLVSQGPDDWPRVGDDLALPSVPEPDGGVVSDITLTNDRISFHTTAVGVPHMVKVSYFPDWRAVGAEGPYRMAPSVMMVIPTQEDVTLEFRSSAAEKAGTALSIITLGAMLSLAAAGLVRRLRT